MPIIDRAKQVYERLLAKRQLRLDYVETFSSPHGQRVLADIMARSGVTVPRHNADPYITQFYEGHRHLAFSIFRQVHGSTDKLPGLMQEEIQRQEQNQADNES